MSKWDSDEWREERNLKFLNWYMGNHAAVACLVTLSSITETWDDIVDEGEADTGKVNEAFVNALFTIQRNPFYAQHRDYLEPVLMAGINAWQDANDLQAWEGDKWRMLAFFTRNVVAELAPAIAFCVGGYQHMRNVSLEMRRFMNHESYSEWEHRHV